MSHYALFSRYNSKFQFFDRHSITSAENDIRIEQRAPLPRSYFCKRKFIFSYQNHVTIGFDVSPKPASNAHGYLQYTNVRVSIFQAICNNDRSL